MSFKYTNVLDWYKTLFKILDSSVISVEFIVYLTTPVTDIHNTTFECIPLFKKRCEVLYVPYSTTDMVVVLVNGWWRKIFLYFFGSIYLYIFNYVYNL